MAIKVIKAVYIIIAVHLLVRAENLIFSDSVFPYRIVCKPEWAEVIKNHSMFVLDNTIPGKKTRFQLKKYKIDTTYNFDNKEWSRLNYAINKKMAFNFGRLIFTDTGSAKKLGNHRAYELFAFFSQVPETDTVWWAEYSRWTDHDGVGFLVSIIGDTLDMKENYATYKTLFDSISITGITSVARNIRTRRRPVVRIIHTATYRIRFDLLGRAIPMYIGRRNRLLVGKMDKQCMVR